MANSEFIVVFTKDNARIIMGGGMGAVSSGDQVVSNPDLSAVRGIPPHLWKLQSGQVVPMNAAEQAKRLMYSEPPANDVTSVLAKHLSKQRNLTVLRIIALAAGLALIAFLVRK
jgi:hypothetical protein